MNKNVLYVFFLLITGFISAQKFSKHIVQEGETIGQIASKYKVTPYDIYQLNPDAQSGLTKNTVILIPKGSRKLPEKSSSKIHTVEPKETLYGIAKMYHISEEALKEANPVLENEGLQIGYVLTIPSGHSKIKSKSTNIFTHRVLPKETKYSIAKQYDITIEDLEKNNPEIVTNLPIGFELIIKGGKANHKSESAKYDLSTKIESEIDYKEYEIQPKETLYSLSRKSGLSKGQLVKLNPQLNSGVEIGMVIQVPISAMMTDEDKKDKVSGIFGTKQKSDVRKKMVMLLPFNLSKTEKDSANTNITRLKKDKFLNMTLDFYSGALMAIDSARTLGFKVDVSIFDSEETKNTSNISMLQQQNHFDGVDAIIGPFYQGNVEKTAALLADSSVAIISPLSKEEANALPNLYQSIPSQETLKRAVFEYMLSNKANIIAIVDTKKASTKLFIEQNYSEVKFASLSESGALLQDSFKLQLAKDKLNFVILASENTGMIKSALAALISAKSNYRIQLVILEANETLNTDEIDFQSLTKLNLLYPSTTNEQETKGARIFKKEYKKKNKVLPNSYATRGFDLTFDTLQRLTDEKTYQESVESTTEQVENKFEFYKRENGSFGNKGVYILYYDTDLIVKQAR